MNFCNPSRVKRDGAGFGSPRFFVPAAGPARLDLAARIRRKAQGCPRRRARRIQQRGAWIRRKTQDGPRRRVDISHVIWDNIRVIKRGD